MKRYIFSFVHFCCAVGIVIKFAGAFYVNKAILCCRFSFPLCIFESAIRNMILIPPSAAFSCALKDSHLTVKSGNESVREGSGQILLFYFGKKKLCLHLVLNSKGELCDTHGASIRPIQQVLHAELEVAIQSRELRFATKFLSQSNILCHLQYF